MIVASARSLIRGAERLLKCFAYLLSVHLLKWRWWWRRTAMLRRGRRFGCAIFAYERGRAIRRS
jgi:hypothetical protein